MTFAPRTKRDDFPSDFLFGVATSAYQIEGGVDLDGRGESIWDRFAHTPGKIRDGTTGDHACDHRRRWREDIALMRALGVPSYRFSVAWPRVMPAGRGPVSVAGLDFYRSLVDALLESGIVPMLTLYHWDLPQNLQDRGGWAHPDSPLWFREYAEVLFDALGDRVPYWITLNEPWCIAVLGHLHGVHAPGTTDLATTLRVSRNLVLAHGEAVGAFRDRATRGEIGISLNMTPCRPASTSAADRAAAATADAFHSWLFGDPIFLGRWPEELVTAFADPPAWKLTDREWKTATAPLDFLGLNYYSRSFVRARADAFLGGENVPQSDREKTSMGWEIHPEGLREMLVATSERYGKPRIFITENGAAFDDRPDDAGFVDDASRIRFIDDHLAEGASAITAGVDLRGWMVWSLLDNYEWAEGYEKRFGIVRVDFETQARTPKASALWFAKLIAPPR